MVVIVGFIIYQKLKSQKLLDKEAELTVQLKEQAKKSAELENKYEEAKANFRLLGNKYKSDDKGKPKL